MAPTAASSIPIPIVLPERSSSVMSFSRSPNIAVSMSPTQGSLHDRFRPDAPHSIRQPKVLRPVERDELRLLLLENISMGAVKAFRDQGFQVEHHTKSWSEDELVEKIGNYHAIGIRSKTRITERVLKAASKVCFCHFLHP